MAQITPMQASEILSQAFVTKGNLSVVDLQVVTEAWRIVVETVTEAQQNDKIPTSK